MAKDVVDVVYPREVRRCRVGDVAACLMRDGTITLQGNGLIDKTFSGITREMLQDMLVALDGIQGEQPEQKPKDLRNAIITGAHALARDIYRMTAHRAVVDVNLHPDVFYRIAAEEYHDGSFRMSRDDYTRGHVRVADDVELSLDRSGK